MRGECGVGVGSKDGVMSSTVEELLSLTDISFKVLNDGVNLVCMHIRSSFLLFNKYIITTTTSYESLRPALGWIV